MFQESDMRGKVKVVKGLGVIPENPNLCIFLLAHPARSAIDRLWGQLTALSDPGMASRAGHWGPGC
jgi:hypothetical protein